MTQEIESTCPLCKSRCPGPFLEEVPPRNWAFKWLYFHCDTCDLIHRDRPSYLTVTEERERYEMHENSEESDSQSADNGYLRFLTPVMDEVKKRMPLGAKGLDFGCGPGPLLARELLRAGYFMNTYDPHFRPDQAPLSEPYDFVTCTEVLEHVKEPNSVLERLLGLISDPRESGDPHGGRGAKKNTQKKAHAKALMFLTGFHQFERESSEAIEWFKRWHYRRDPTHICFYSEKSFCYWALQHQCEALFPSRNVAVIIPANGTN